MLALLGKLGKGLGAAGTVLTAVGNIDTYFRDGIQGNDIQDFAVDTGLPEGDSVNREQYIAAMSALGYSGAEAEGLIHLSKVASDVALRINNFVPRDDGVHELWKSGDRDGFFRISKDGREFLGTLSDAYEFVHERKRQ